MAEAPPGSARRTAVAALVLLGSVVGRGADAQTVAPIIAEYQGKARGKFQIVNSTLYPIRVVLEPLSFSMDSAGQASYSPLDPSIRLQLSKTSLRVGPKESYTVSYRAEASHLPAWFTVYATMTKARASSGLQVGLRMPHTVYLLPERGLARDSVVFARATFQKATRTIDAEVENGSQAYARVKEIDVVSASAHKTFAGFPFFPHQRRMLHLEWDRPEIPERLVLHFKDFEVEHALSP